MRGCLIRLPFSMLNLEVWLEEWVGNPLSAWIGCKVTGWPCKGYCSGWKNAHEWPVKSWNGMSNMVEDSRSVIDEPKLDAQSSLKSHSMSTHTIRGRIPVIK